MKTLVQEFKVGSAPKTPEAVRKAFFNFKDTIIYESDGETVKVYIESQPEDQMVIDDFIADQQTELQAEYIEVMSKCAKWWIPK
jgi:hypothetical protein